MPCNQVFNKQILWWGENVKELVKNCLFFKTSICFENNFMSTEVTGRIHSFLSSKGIYNLKQWTDFVCLCVGSSLPIMCLHLQNWAFVARFCLLSEEGQFEYIIEYDMVSLACVWFMIMFYPHLCCWVKFHKTCIIISSYFHL